jgi:hypothetical protein
MTRALRESNYHREWEIMPQLERIGSWTRVPHGSRIRISVTGTTEENLVIASVFVIRDDGFEQTVPDSSVQPGPVEILLEFPRSYSLLVDLKFVTAAKAQVHAAVISSGGNVIPQDGAPPAEFDSTIQGTEGQLSGITFFLTTGPN